LAFVNDRFQRLKGIFTEVATVVKGRQDILCGDSPNPDHITMARVTALLSRYHNNGLQLTVREMIGGGRSKRRRHNKKKYIVIEFINIVLLFKNAARIAIERYIEKLVSMNYIAREYSTQYDTIVTEFGNNGETASSTKAQQSILSLLIDEVIQYKVLEEIELLITHTHRKPIWNHSKKKLSMLNGKRSISRTRSSRSRAVQRKTPHLISNKLETIPELYNRY
jgi:hypothetical protein